MVRIVVVFMFLLTVVISSTSFGASVFEGVWTVEDTGGNKFEIVLSSNGTAKSNLRPDMIGSWKEQDDAAVIMWETGWTTKIVKSASQYLHLAYRPHSPPNGPPAGSSKAQKIK